MNLNQVILPATNVKTSAEFYRRLGLTEIVENLPDYARFEFPAGDATLSLHRVARVPGETGIVIYFECEELDRVVQQLKTQGIQFDTDPRDQPWLWREAYLRDPDGNAICLYYGGKNRKYPPWRLPR